MQGVDNEFKERYYGKKLSKGAYFCLYRGLIAPKVLESLSYGKIFQPNLQLNIDIEDHYIKMNTFLNNAAAINIEETSEEFKAHGSEIESTSAESQITHNNDIVDPLIAKLLNSDAFFEKIHGSSNDLRNTIKL